MNFRSCRLGGDLVSDDTTTTCTSSEGSYPCVLISYVRIFILQHRNFTIKNRRVSLLNSIPLWDFAGISHLCGPALQQVFKF